MTVKAVFFDVGETLVDETQLWGAWADFLGVPRLAFFGALGAVIERGEHHRRVFEIVRPGLMYAQAKLELAQAGLEPPSFTLEDFYPDAIPCLQTLKARGFRIGISGNQPESAETILRSLDVPVDFIAGSASWGIEKPDVRFFEKILETTDLQPHEVAYVGDRLDNDVLPALAVGMKAVFIRRGPWGMVHATRPEVSRASRALETLSELPDWLQTPSDF